jgi:protein-L-isoaspartate(D-aspartate) O-methyltransferase
VFIGSVLRASLLTVGCWLGWSWDSMAASVSVAAPEDRQWAEARQRMVQEDVIAAGVRDARVCAAMRDTPRHLFVPVSQRRWAYVDMSLPIGDGQTISPPFVVAYMTEQLNPQPGDKVLEIGTGSGYQAAVLSSLVADVYSIEIVESLGRRAAETLRRLNYANVHTRVGDGFQGWPEFAPFDKIIVTCSPENVPPALVEQLREGGRLVIPLGERYQQTLYLLKKEGGKLKRETLEPTFFVPMTGRAEELRRNKDESGLPQLLNGSFESVSEEAAPTGWYYVRQATVVEDPKAPDGRRVLRLCNETPGRGAQVLQSLAMDGRRVRELEFSVWIKAEKIRPGQTASELPRAELMFFDDQRAPIGSSTVGPWRNTVSWTKRRVRIKVPNRARLAMLAVGLFGATGQLSIDHLKTEVTGENLP